MSTEKERYRIVAGPNEMDLVTSLFGRGHGDHKANFTMEAINEVRPELRKIHPQIIITALEHAGGQFCDHEWIFKAKSTWGNGMWSGTYSHKTRQGFAETAKINI